MIVVMSPKATETEINEVMNFIKEKGFKIHLSRGKERTIIGVIGDDRYLLKDALLAKPGVEDVVSILKPFKLVSREFHEEDTVIKVKDTIIGGGTFTVIAGPCSIESKSQIQEVAWAVKEAGAKVLRGGAFKPRTSPYSFQGLGVKGLEYLALAGEETGLPVISEALSPTAIDVVAEFVDIIQIGARNMQNFTLLTKAGKTKRPVFLKRGMMSKIEEFLLAAEYILLGKDCEKSCDVILCERGIRTFETYTRNTLDISAVPLIKKLSHLPIFVDPSHATGVRDLVAPLALSSLVAGANGVMVEVHPNPEKALSDGAQSLTIPMFSDMMKKIKELERVYKR